MHYPLEVMLTCVRWYVSYPLSFRHLEEMIASLLPLWQVFTRILLTGLVKVGRDFESNAVMHRMSSLQDLEAGRPLEIHETMGFALQQAARCGLSLPLVESFYHLIGALSVRNLLI
jgi:ketopantoate reductase